MAEGTVLRDRMLRPAEAAEKLGVSRSTLYEMIGQGLLKKPQPIGKRAVGWRESALDDFLNRRAAAGSLA